MSMRPTDSGPITIRQGWKRQTTRDGKTKTDEARGVEAPSRQGDPEGQKENKTERERKQTCQNLVTEFTWEIHGCLLYYSFHFSQSFRFLEQAMGRRGTRKKQTE